MKCNFGKLHSVITCVVLILSLSGLVKTDILTQFFTGSRNAKTDVKKTQATNFIHGIQVKQSGILQEYIKMLLQKSPSKKTTPKSLHVSTTSPQNNAYVSTITRAPAFTGNKMFQLNSQKNLDRIKKLMSQDKDGRRQSGNVFFRQSSRLQLQRTTPSSISGIITTVPQIKDKKSFKVKSSQKSQSTSKRNRFTKGTERLTTQPPPPPIILKQTVKTSTLDSTKHTSGTVSRVTEVEIHPSASVKIQQHSTIEFVTDAINKETSTFEQITKPPRQGNKSENLVLATLTSQQPLLKTTLTSIPTTANMRLKVTERVPMKDVSLPSRIKDNGTVLSTLAVLSDKESRGSVHFEVPDTVTVKKITILPSVIVNDQNTTIVANDLKQTTKSAEPLEMISLKNDRYENNSSTTTETYTEQTSIPNKSDKVEQATKVLVSDKSNPILEQLKNPFFWLELNVKNTATDTKPEEKTPCSEKCKVFENVCKNGGTCVNTCTGFMCVCAPGFDGYFCDKIKTLKNTTVA